MRIRWTEPAAHDLTHICDYIEEHDSSNTARRVALAIYERISALKEFSERGRPGRKAGTRESWYSLACRIWQSIEFAMRLWRFSAFFMVRKIGRKCLCQKE